MAARFRILFLTEELSGDFLPKRFQSQPTCKQEVGRRRTSLYVASIAIFWARGLRREEKKSVSQKFSVLFSSGEKLKDIVGRSSQVSLG
jgi:hypothetical protein